MSREILFSSIFSQDQMDLVLENIYNELPTMSYALKYRTGVLLLTSDNYLILQKNDNETLQQSIYDSAQGDVFESTQNLIKNNFRISAEELNCFYLIGMNQDSTKNGAVAYQFLAKTSFTLFEVFKLLLTDFTFISRLEFLDLSGNFEERKLFINKFIENNRDQLSEELIVGYQHYKQIMTKRKVVQ